MSLELWAETNWGWLATAALGALAAIYGTVKLTGKSAPEQQKKAA